jgi:hypothetical protein
MVGNSNVGNSNVKKKATSLITFHIGLSANNQPYGSWLIEPKVLIGPRVDLVSLPISHNLIVFGGIGREEYLKYIIA